MKSLRYFLLVLLLGSGFNAMAQISQTIIKGSNSNVIYQNFYSEAGGTLQSIKLSTDNIGSVTVRFFENEKQISPDKPMWEVIDVVKNQKGEISIDLSNGTGKNRTLEPDRQYSFSVVGAGNIHHSFLEDTYEHGNLRFEDGIERKGDLFFELEFQKETPSFKQTSKTTKSEIVMYPNPSSQEVQFKNLTENASINIYDVGGRKALSTLISPLEAVKIHSLKEGKYFLVLKTKNHREVKQLVVARP